MYIYYIYFSERLQSSFCFFFVFFWFVYIFLSSTHKSSTFHIKYVFFFIDFVKYFVLKIGSLDKKIKNKPHSENIHIRKYFFFEK